MIRLKTKNLEIISNQATQCEIDLGVRSLLSLGRINPVGEKGIIEEIIFFLCSFFYEGLELFYRSWPYLQSRGNSGRTLHLNLLHFCSTVGCAERGSLNNPLFCFSGYSIEERVG